MYLTVNNIGSKKTLANYRNLPSFLPIFTISITFLMQMASIHQSVFHQTSYSSYSPKILTAKVFYYTVLACKNYKICEYSNMNMNKTNTVFSVLVTMTCHQTFSGQNKHLFSHIKGDFLEFTEYPDNFQSLS